MLRRLLAGLVALPVILGGLNSLILILLVFSLWHASVALGGRLTPAFFAITTVTSWIFEEIGVVTGLVYGPYHYTSTLGPWLGSVPVLIPLAWFMMVYPSYVVANLIVDGWPVGTPGGRGHLVRLALVGALVMTAWDLVVDPILSGPTVGAWVWERGGPYYGVPVQNYLGWIVTTFTVYLLYRSVERRWTLAGRAALPGSKRDPVLADAAMMLANLLSGAAPAAIAAIVVIAPVAMGMPVVAVLVRPGESEGRGHPPGSIAGALSGRSSARQINRAGGGGNATPRVVRVVPPLVG
ncbi:MAG: carotenoid biosynthesis protein [Chloroflexi bacterium]|nr:carotenoid biosynthesis protein [Chloroflexota bacterium]